MTTLQIRTAERFLKKNDDILCSLIELYGPCKLGQNTRPPFHTLVWAIINQQLSVRAAKTIEDRILQRLGTNCFEAQHFHRLQDKTLRACGLSGSKIRYIRELARQVRKGALLLEDMHQREDTGVAAALTALPGIGPWTVDMFLMFSLRRPDVFPLGDLALRKSIQQHYGLSADAGNDAYFEIAERWRPYRTVASWYCWAAVD